MNFENFEKLLLTGARGNSAYYFFKILEKEKFTKEIKVISRSKSKNSYFNQLKLNINILNGDIADEDFLLKSMENIDPFFTQQIWKIVNAW